ATTVSVNYAIDANRQLVRNEKLLEFATGVMQIDRSIVQQHPNYWGTHIATAKVKARELTENNPLLLVQMYELLGKQEVDAAVGQSMVSAYREAMELSKSLHGENSSETLILEAKWVRSLNSRDVNKFEEIDSILNRWNDGSKRNYAELLLLAASIKLDSGDKLSLVEGNRLALEADSIARNELGNDEEIISKAASIRAWSFVFKDGSADAIERAIELEESIVRLLENSDTVQNSNLNHHKNILAIAKYSRGTPSDIESAIELNEQIVDELILKTGYGHNEVWQSMNNLAMCYVAKAKHLENKPGSQTGQVVELQNMAALLWSRILQQSQFKKSDDYDVHEWYLLTFQEALPEHAPTKEQWSEWVSFIEEPLMNN
ncbi:MAG: hypothetical protein H8E91_02345, partial [Planctomycetes bacterium]|nr:hypothetical protein [Planctomycetota bacterium]